MSNVLFQNVGKKISKKYFPYPCAWHILKKMFKKEHQMFGAKLSGFHIVLQSIFVLLSPLDLITIIRPGSAHCPVINVKETWLNWLCYKFRCIFWKWGLVKILSSAPGSVVPLAIFLIKIFNFHLFCLHFHQLEEFWKLNGAVAVNINLHFMMIFQMLGSGYLIDFKVLVIQKQMWHKYLYKPSTF